MIQPLRASLIAFAALALPGSWTTARAPERFEFAQVHMGMPVRLVVYAAGRTPAESAARVAFARIAELDATLSDYRPDSELSRLSETSNAWVRASDDLYRVLATACEVARASGGAFDPTVGPLTAIWRDARRDSRRPADAAIAAARDRVSWTFVAFDDRARAVRLARSGMRLDLGGIAKGFALDQARDALDRHGFRITLLEAGGDIVTGDPPPGAAGWRIDAPYGDARVRARAAVLARAALATSGPASQFVDLDGVHHSHVIDPRSGAALTSPRIASVIATDATIADAVATAIGAMSESAAARLARAFPAVSAWSVEAPAKTAK